MKTFKEFLAEASFSREAVDEVLDVLENEDCTARQLNTALDTMLASPADASRENSDGRNLVSLFLSAIPSSEVCETADDPKKWSRSALGKKFARVLSGLGANLKPLRNYVGALENSSEVRGVPTGLGLVVQIAEQFPQFVSGKSGERLFKAIVGSSHDEIDENYTMEVAKALGLSNDKAAKIVADFEQNNG